jgi:flavin-binding protein dodecin
MRVACAALRARGAYGDASYSTAGGTMSVARITEITAESAKSFEDAIQQGIGRANKTLKNVKGAWVQDQKVTVDQGKISMYRVTMKVTFVLEE